MSFQDKVHEVIEKQNVEEIEESFEEILSGDVREEDTEAVKETESVCSSCMFPLDVDEDQTIVAYCTRCETTVFIERRIVS